MTYKNSITRNEKPIKAIAILVFLAFVGLLVVRIAQERNASTASIQMSSGE